MQSVSQYGFPYFKGSKHKLAVSQYGYLFFKGNKHELALSQYGYLFFKSRQARACPFAIRICTDIPNLNKKLMAKYWSVQVLVIRLLKKYMNKKGIFFNIT